MNPSETGFVFAYLLRWREIAGNPPGRNQHEGESEAARILANCSGVALLDFEDFLRAQGFSLKGIEGIEFGIPPKPGAPNTIWILTRKRGEDPAPYLNDRWFIDMMRDGRRNKEVKRTEIVFWIARLWLTLQWFFYDKIDRLPSEVSRYRDAMVSSRLFVEILHSGIEKMGNAGRPEGDAGVAWDFFWKDKSNITTWANRFLRVMEQAGMIAPAGNAGEWYQSIAAAIDMAENAAQEIAYLLPPKDPSAAQATAAFLQGEVYSLPPVGAE